MMFRFGECVTDQPDGADARRPSATPLRVYKPHRFISLATPLRVCKPHWFIPPAAPVGVYKPHRFISLAAPLRVYRPHWFIPPAAPVDSERDRNRSKIWAGMSAKSLPAWCLPHP